MLIITRHRLHENNGGANGSKGFIHCIARLFENCSLICPAFEGTATTYIPANIKVYPYYDRRSNIRKGIDMWCGHICANASFVRNHLKTHRYDIIVIDHSFAGASLVRTIKDTGAKIITIHHNVERDYLNDNRKDYSILWRWPYIHFAQIAEKDSLELSNLNLTVTEKDAKEFQSWYVDKKNIQSWGNFEYRPMQQKTFQQKDNSKIVFVISGSLYFEQSLTPIIEFMNRYWPIVNQLYSHAELIIAGRNPRKLLISICGNFKNVYLFPNPVDMEEIIKRCNYYICPINAGSGRKLRIIDGLKQGLPILCHEVSAAGYEQIAKAGCLFSYHDEKSFKSALQAMVHAQICPEIVYDTFRNCFSLETGTERLRQILLQTNLL